MAVQRRRRRRRKRKQRGGALIRRKPRLVDKIAHGMSMFLSGPAPGFGLALGKLGGQALKGITDNVQHYRRQRGGGWWSDFKRNTRQGYKETQRPHQTKQSPSTSIDEPSMVRRRRLRRRRRQRGGFLNLLVPAMVGLGKAVALETDKRIKRTIQKANQRYRRRHR